jgi:hypothetical protein
VWKDGRRPLRTDELAMMRHMAGRGARARDIGWAMSPPRSAESIVKLAKRYGIVLLAKGGGPQGHRNGRGNAKRSNDRRLRYTDKIIETITRMADEGHSAAAIGRALTPKRSRGSIGSACIRYGIVLKGKSGAPAGNRNGHANLGQRHG